MKRIPLKDTERYTLKQHFEYKIDNVHHEFTTGDK